MINKMAKVMNTNEKCSCILMQKTYGITSSCPQ